MQFLFEIIAKVFVSHDKVFETRVFGGLIKAKNGLSSVGPVSHNRFVIGTESLDTRLYNCTSVADQDDQMSEWKQPEEVS